MAPKSRKKAAPAPEPVLPAAPAPCCAHEGDPAHVILQLPIPTARVDEILAGTIVCDDPPAPYVSSTEWTMSCTETGLSGGPGTDEKPPTNCFWCCHPIPAQKFGMPIEYDASHRMFTVYGQFCSLHCVAAHNMATHMGSDRMWDIHGWVQMMAKMLGLTLPVRPAPSRFVLKMFGGPMDIDEFRAIHQTCSRTVVLNVPPLVNVRPQVEVVNTSFLNTHKERKKPAERGGGSTLGKMNISYTLAAPT